MNLFATSPQWIVWLLVVLLAAATIQDAIQLRISNIICGSVLVLAIVAMVASGLRVGLWQNCVVFAVVLTIGAALFAREVLGGGDVKLFAAVGLWVDVSTALRLVIAIVIAGGLLALTIIALRTVAPKSLAGRVKTLQPKAGIPYGIAIAAGTLLVLAMPAPGVKEVPYVPIKVPAKVPAQAG
jgi:prepilin peptidase CpaA